VTDVDTRRLSRLSREPSRVFGANDEKNHRWPLVTVQLDGDEWYGPGFTSSLFRGADCPVLRRALERLGHVPCGRTHEQFLEEWLLPGGATVALPPPEMVQLSDKHIGAYHLVGDWLVPAVAVAYTVRRYGTGAWEYIARFGGIRYRTDTGLIVALVARVRVPEQIREVSDG